VCSGFQSRHLHSFCSGIFHNSRLAVARLGRVPGSPIFLARKIWLRLSIPHESQAVGFLISTKNKTALKKAVLFFVEMAGLNPRPRDE
jgi:hypothetical protein